MLKRGIAITQCRGSCVCVCVGGCVCQEQQEVERPNKDRHLLGVCVCAFARDCMYGIICESVHHVWGRVISLCVCVFVCKVLVSLMRILCCDCIYRESG